MRKICPGIEDTRRAGAHLALRAAAGDVYGLTGALGAGKTEFVRGFVAALAPDADVHSPTFTLVNVYETAEFPIYHVDFYRLKRAAELRETGFDEWCGGDGVCLIEWADMFPDLLPPGTVTVSFHVQDERTRVITIE